jgi:hypothetical protein
MVRPNNGTLELETPGPPRAHPGLLCNGPPETAR